MARTIGITGNIACGKTFVGQLLLELGAECYIDADALVHRLYERDQPVASKIAEEFGLAVMKDDGSVDRKALGAIVFQDAQALHRLECIVHPAVSVLLLDELATVSEAGIAVIDAVKLLEGQSGKLCQSKWLIICPEEQELARLMARNSLSEEEARTRLRAQPPVEPKLALVDEVIDNGGTRQETQRQVKAAFERFFSIPEAGLRNDASSAAYKENTYNLKAERSSEKY
ncbi:MAG: dephospho-CoA kinase [Ktedonobacteraceae bacterium]|nr:dephospho-CoA kinase [Ktedonobacteraceae bacterium]